MSLMHTYTISYSWMVFFIWEKCIKCFSKCNMHFAECPDLKPLSHSTRRKAGDSSPEHREASHDMEASGRTGSKKRESCAYVYIVFMHGVLYLG